LGPRVGAEFSDVAAILSPTTEKSIGANVLEFLGLERGCAVVEPRPVIGTNQCVDQPEAASAVKDLGREPGTDPLDSEARGQPGRERPQSTHPHRR